MCGRYTLTQLPRDLVPFQGSPEINLIFQPRYNIAPGQNILSIIAADGGQRKGQVLRWGLVPHFSQNCQPSSKMINARSETVAVKPAFKKLLTGKRCLIPADGFFEWQKQGAQKTPCWIHMKQKKTFAFAGLWDEWTDGHQKLVSGTILTTAANSTIRPIHQRMPVILTPDAQQIWLNPLTAKDQLLSLFAPFPSDALEIVVVNSTVNSVGNDSPACITPATALLIQQPLFSSDN